MSSNVWRLTITAEQVSARQQPVSLWRNRDFLLLWSGQTVSTTGTEIALLAYPLLVLTLTHSPALAGFVGALRSLPYAFLCLPVGALVDRWDRKRVMVLCDTGCALAVASIPLALALHRLTLAQIYAVALIEGILYVFFNLANTACLPRIVSQEQLPIAVSRNYAAFSLAILLGPLLGGALYSVGQGLPFLIDALSFAVSVVTISFMQTAFQGDRSAARRSLRADIGEGLAWLWHRPFIRYMTFFMTTLLLLANGLPLILIVLAQRAHATSGAIGILLAVGGVGAIIGSLLAPRIQRRFGFPRAFLAVFWLFVLSWPLMAFGLPLLALALVGAVVLLFWTVFDMLQFGYRLALIPDALQGRVNSVYRLGAYGGQTLGFALAGVLLQGLGPEATVLALAAGLVALAIITTAVPYVRTTPPTPLMDLDKAGDKA
jgi:MFS family permease